jgi:F420-non-reducing hydrogenase large subunit
MVTKANLIVATVFNNPAMNISVAQAAKAFIKNGVVSDGLLNMVEMAFRAYDPCMSCATHSLPGQMPLLVTVKDTQGGIVRSIRRD